MRTHKWGAPSVVVGGRIPAEVAAKMDRDCQEFGATRTDILAYLLAQHYDYPVDSPFQEPSPAAEQLPLDAVGAAASDEGRKPRRTKRAA